LLSLKVIIGHFDVAETHLEGSVGVAKVGDFLLEDALSIGSLGFRLFVFRLPFVHLVLKIGRFVF
jgi:hypothetical protein